MIGRLAQATLSIDDPRVSEAHALVSLRSGKLWLLSLRRLVAVDGKPVSEVELREGLAIALATDIELEVESVTLPERVLTIEAPGLPCRPLAQVSSLWPGPPPRVVAKYEPDAPAHVWWRGEGFRAELCGQYRPIAYGDEFSVGDTVFRIGSMAIAGAGQASTCALGQVTAPMRIVAHYDSVELHPAGRSACVVGGVGARILSELVALDGPAAWETIAREVWTDGASEQELRRRWDAALRRLRAKLQTGGIRADLLRLDGTGSLQLLLYDGDRVEDRT